MSNLDVVIRHGEIVTAAGSAGCADIGISNGTIVQIGGDLEGRLELEATGKLILPGGIDAHVHVSVPPQEEKIEPHWVDDFTTGSAAALAGGNGNPDGYRYFADPAVRRQMVPIIQRAREKDAQAAEHITRALARS